MKKNFLFLLIFLISLILVGCGKYNEKDLINDLEKNIKKLNSYKLTGVLEITNNDDTFQYDVDVSYKKDNNYRVSLVNKSNNHEQIILKNNEGVYVITPSLNKSFKFQSDWPNNNSQIYLLQSILNDIKSDNDKKFEEVDGKYILTTKVNYPNNNQLVKQKITIDKDLKICQIEVMDSNDIVQMIMKINSVDYGSDFNDDFFKLDSIVDDIDIDEKKNDKKADDTKQNKNEDLKNQKENDTDSNQKTNDDTNNNSNENTTDNTKTTSTIDDIIYPLYIPIGTSLASKEKIAKTDGERVILTFDGEKPFLLVEETSTVNDEFSVIPTFGEPFFLTDTIGALTDKSLSWSSNGIDYYIVSDTISQVELIEIASSITAIPTIK